MGFVIRLEVVLPTWWNPNGAECESQLLHSTAVFVFYGYIIRFHIINGLEPPPFVISQFPQVRNRAWFSWVVLRTRHGRCWLAVFSSEVVGKSLFPSSLGLSAEFNFLWVVGLRFWFLAG